MTRGGSSRVTRENRTEAVRNPASPSPHRDLAFLVINAFSDDKGLLQPSMPLSSSDGVLLSTISRLSDGLDAVWSAVRQARTISLSTALASVLSPAWQPQSFGSLGNARLIDNPSNATGVSRTITDSALLSSAPTHRGGEGFYEWTAMLIVFIASRCPYWLTTTSPIWVDAQYQLNGRYWDAVNTNSKHTNNKMFR